MNGLIAELRSIVGNEGGFLHKSFIGRAVGSAVKGFITGGPTGALAGGIRTLTTTARPTVSRTRTARVTATSIQERERGKGFKFGNGGLGIVVPGNGVGLHPNGAARVCPDGQVWNRRLKTCLAVGSPVAAEFAESVPVMGRYGAGTVAGSEIIDRATCLRGQHLGNDGVCYNKGQITNKQRMWPAGAKPLLSGGEMNAIRTAATARGRVARAAGRLGIVAKAPRRRAPAGHKAKLVHA